MRKKAGQALHSLSEESRARAPWGQEVGSSQEESCSPSGPRDLALGSVRCLEEALAQA